MDLSTILGMVLAVTSISVGDILEGGNPRDLEAKLFNFLSHDDPRISQFDKG